MVLYNVEVTKNARREIRNLPGNMRPRVIAVLKSFKNSPRPSNSKKMNLANLEVKLPDDIELYRLRLESWRIVYVLEEEIKLLTVLAIRKRPPYQYNDLSELVKNM